MNNDFCALDFRLCGNIDPSENHARLRFPEHFHEILIDMETFQYDVVDIADLSKGDHIRFCKRRTKDWLMGWVVRTSTHMISVILTCEENRGEQKRYNIRSLQNIARVPMIQPDILQVDFDGDLEWSTSMVSFI